jgi:hypothetical protein
LLIDAGALAMSKDVRSGTILGQAERIESKWGIVLGHPQMNFCSITQELGVIRLPAHQSVESKVFYLCLILLFIVFSSIVVMFAIIMSWTRFAD